MKEYSHVLSPMSLWQHTPLGDEDGFAPHERLPASATVRNGSLGDDNGGNTEALHCETAGVISVEFVRNEEDVWLVLINGAKSEGFNATPNNPVQGEYEYSLPPPLSTPQPVDATSSADRLIVGVRLESGALRPEKVELFVETLLVELEQQSASVVERKYVVRQTKSLKAVELRQCAVEDPCAEAILLPYPIYAPKQSTVALVSFDEAARWQDRHNTETRRLFQSLYSWRIPIHLRQFFNSNNATATLEQINNAADQAAKLKLHKANANTTRTRQFGSGPVSSTRALTIAVGNIVDVCERVSHDEKNASYDHTKLTWDASRLNDVRAGLTVFNHVLTNGDDSLALLDGLCLVKDVSDPIGSTMGFIWEDLAGELQTRATVIKYKFLITELDGSTTTHVISCTPECGFFAHALTTTLAVEIEQLHAELDALRDCIEDKHGSRASRRWERIPHDPYVSDVKSEFTLPKDFNKNQILTNIEYLKARYTTTDGVFPAQPTGHWRTGISSAGNVTIKRTLQQVVKARTVWPMLVKHQTPSEMSDGWSTSPQATGISILHRVLQGTKYLEQVGLLVAAALGVYVTTDLSIGVIITAFNTWYSLKNAPVSSIFDSIVKRYGRAQKMKAKLLATEILKVRSAAAASSYDNALVAINGIHGTDSTVSNHSGLRFHFIQLYESDKHVIVDIPQATINEYSSYDTDIFQLSAPDDILRDTTSVVEERRIPVLETVRVLVGSPKDAVLVTASQTAAHAAHSKLISLLSVDRQTFYGRHLSGSVHELALVTAIRAIALINGVYTEIVEAPSPYAQTPTGDDDFWLCFQSGTAARVALEHLPSFARWGQTTSLSDNDRRSVAKFSQDWKKEAVRVASIATRSAQPIVHESGFQTEQQTRQLCRFYALTNDIALATLVAKGSQLTNDALQLTLEYHSFDEQREVSQRTPGIGFYYRDALRVAVAARCVDLNAFSDLKVRPPSPEKSLSAQIMNISLMDGARQLFYFPMGYSFLVAPGATPFDPGRLNTRVVSLERLLAIQSQYMGELTRVSTNSSGVILRHAKEARGLQRHPLMISTSPDVIEICYPAFPTPPARGPNHAVRLNHAVLRARALVFAADRVYNGIGLALVRGSPLVPVCLHNGGGGPSGVDSAIVLVVSLAMIEADIGCSIESVGVYPSLRPTDKNDRDAVDAGLKLIETSLNQALSRGCRYVQLSELAIALSLEV